MSNKASTMDIGDIQPKNRPVEILHPSTREPIGLTIVIRPLDDKRVEAVRRRNLTAAMNQRTKPTAEQSDANAIALLVAATEELIWAPGVTFKGEVLDSSEASVKKLYLQAPWIKKQVDVELGDDAAFFETSGKS